MGLNNLRAGQLPKWGPEASLNTFDAASLWSSDPAGQKQIHCNDQLSFEARPHIQNNAFV